MANRYQDKILYNYRPAVHYAPPEGTWINDPNGMVYIDGKYHLFFQYFNGAPHYGPMHWGHAVSEDLLHWKDLPIAIYPDELGVIFSGSCVYDKDNVSGFGKFDKMPLIAVYTSHHFDGVNHTETQSIAYSTDYEHFEKYYGNPVIPNPGQRDFRDPKAFWNPIKKCYSLVLAAGDHVDFYSSKYLKEWKKTGEFKAGTHGLGGICECPDCFPILTEDGEEKWILFISMITQRDGVVLSGDEITEDNKDYYRMTHVTQYYVGDFDGDTFHDTECAPIPLLPDFGTDNYAPVTFQNLEEKVMIGWADNWDYARVAPSAEAGKGFRGKMTFPRRMRLVKTSEGLRLAFSNEGLDSYRVNAYPMVSGANRLRSQTFGLKVKVEGTGSLLFKNQAGEQILVEVNDDEILLNRENAGQKDFSEVYSSLPYAISRAPRAIKGESSMEILMDNCILEILADDGLTPFTTCVFPTRPYEILEVSGNLKVEYFPLG